MHKGGACSSSFRGGEGFLTVIVTVSAKPEVPGLVFLRQGWPCRFRGGVGGGEGLEVADVSDFHFRKGVVSGGLPAGCIHFQSVRTCSRKRYMKG